MKSVKNELMHLVKVALDECSCQFLCVCKRENMSECSPNEKEESFFMCIHRKKSNLLRLNYKSNHNYLSNKAHAAVSTFKLPHMI